MEDILIYGKSKNKVFKQKKDKEVLLPVAQEDRHSHPWSLAPFLLSQSQRWPARVRVGVMKTAMNDIFMHDQQPVIAMITRSSP